MALENGEVLQNLTQQLQEVTQQLNTLQETRVKLIGAIEGNHITIRNRSREGR